MKLQDLTKLISDWDLNGTDSIADSKYGAMFDQLNYHAKNEWRDYVPAMHSDFTQNYMDRLAMWIGNTSVEADQKLLLEYATFISFFSHGDFQSLYRTAMHREIYGWVASQTKSTLNSLRSTEFHNLVSNHVLKSTWFCPITDSMDINEFYKANHLAGIGHRPGFATLEMLAERAGKKNGTLVDNIKYYMSNPSLNPKNPAPAIERIVLLEDIVGSASQCISTIKWAVANLDKPILFVPLILCPNGVDPLDDVEKNSQGKLTVRPVVKLRRGDLLGPERQSEPGWSIAEKLEEFACTSSSKLQIREADAFGYKKTGCSLVTFANTPDNTLPIVWKSTNKWKPLFPRVYRGTT